MLIKEFQAGIAKWMLECFGADAAADVPERNHRFLEEALELVQACGCTASEAHQLVDYTFGRPIGEPTQEVGGTMVTLAALCSANGLDLEYASEKERTRVWSMLPIIRAKHAAKPKYSPLPIYMPAPDDCALCKGTGRIRYGQGNHTYTLLCEPCHGTGKIK